MLPSICPSASARIALLFVLAVVVSSLRILREYERGVVFLLGRFWKVKGPGLVDPRCPASSRWCASICAPSCSTCRRRT